MIEKTLPYLLCLWDAVFGRAFSRRGDRADERAKEENARYRYIESRIAMPDGSLVLETDEDFDLWEEQTALLESTAPPP